MDKNRSERTAGVLRALKQGISQLLLVSHKFPKADYYIMLAETLVAPGTDAQTLT